MSSFKKYFLYHFKKSALRQMLVCFVCVIFSIMQMSGLDEYYSPSGVAFILGVLCSVIPVLELAAFKNRRNLDSMFSLPVSRKKQALAHYLNGIIQISAAYTFSCALSLIQLISFNRGAIIGYFIAYYFLSLIAGVLIYSIFMFLFNQANTVIDGILFEILGAFALFFAVQAIRTVTDTLGNHPYATYSVFAPIGSGGLYQIVRNLSFSLGWSYIVMLTVWTLIGIGAIFGYFYTFERKKVEAVGGISDALFGYKMFIPVWAYSLVTMGLMEASIFVCISMLIGYIIYRRGFQFTKSDLISMIMIIPFLSLGLI